MSILNSWISVSVNSCRDPCPWFDWLISIFSFCWTLAPSFLFFCFSVSRIEEEDHEFGTLSIKWLIGAVTRHQWTLVARCACPLVSTARFVSWVCEGLSGWTDGVEEPAEQNAVSSPRPATHAVFSSIHHCQQTADSGVCWLHLSYGAIPHATCLTLHISHSACMWLTWLNELLSKDTAKIGSICNREQGWSLMYVSQGSNRVDKGIKLWN